METLEINDFTTLLLGTLAQESLIFDLNNPNQKIAFLPFSYKQIIENILCAENGWKEEFSSLIDIEEYFDDHFAWEHKLTYEIQEVLNTLNKKLEIDLKYDRLLITFTQEELNLILAKYPKVIKNKMNHFANLLTGYIYTREYQEKFNDFYATSVAKMHDRYEALIGLNNNLEYKRRKKLSK